MYQVGCKYTISNQQTTHDDENKPTTTQINKYI